MLFYRAALPLSSRTLNFAAGLVRRHLKAIGAGLVTLADKGCQGSAWAKVPYKGRNKPGP